MNVVATHLFRYVSIALAGALLTLTLLALIVSSIALSAHTVALDDVSPFRWA
ncbi:MAG: hypothetical protein ABI452_04005 [Candidatus Limnocylindrales bacterium]